MSDPDGPLAIIGIGNVLLGDDGAGPRVAWELAREAGRGDARLPADAVLHDGGTLGLDLLPIVADARAALFVDAADLGLAPGTIVVIDRERLREGGFDSAVSEVVSAALLAGILPGTVGLVGIQAGAVGMGLSLSAAVAQALPAAVEATVREAWRLSDEADARRVRARDLGPRGIPAPAGVVA